MTTDVFAGSSGIAAVIAAGSIAVSCVLIWLVDIHSYLKRIADAQDKKEPTNSD